jgi:hypothetical protein
MSARILAAIMVSAVLLSTAAHAEWSSVAGIENHTDKAALPSSSLASEGAVSRYALHLKWTEDSDSGLLYAYSGKLYSGRSLDAHIPTGNSPATAQTDFSGITHEGQLISRRYLGNYRLDYVGGVGWDSWRRSINANQIEDYSVWFLRTGISLDQPLQAAGFHGGGGLKLPFKTSEDIHLVSSGFNSNPQLAPGKSVNLYAELAYRTGNYWDIVGYFDSWRFSQAEPLYTSSGSNLYSIVQPQSSVNTLGLKALYSF